MSERSYHGATSRSPRVREYGVNGILLSFKKMLLAAIKRTGAMRSSVVWCDGSSDRSLMVDLLSYFSFQPVLHDWCYEGRGVCHPVCGMVHIKDPLLLVEKSSTCNGSSEFHLSLS